MSGNRLVEVLYDAPLPLVWIVYFLVMLATVEGGLALGRRARRRAGDAEEVRWGVGFVTSGMLGLMAFTLGLTLSMAQGRFETRRQLVVAEANAIGTSYLRAQAVGGPEGSEIMRVLRPYAELRLRFVQGPQAALAAERIDARTGELQGDLWRAAAEAGRRDPGPITALLLDSLNTTFDQALSVREAFESRVPLGALRMLLFASLLSVGAMGYQFGLAGTRHHFITGLLLLLWATAFILIVDLDRPRSGSVVVDPAPLLWTLEGLKPPG